MQSKIPDKYLYFPIISLAIFLLYKIIQFYKILNYFPFAIGDLSQRMAQFFLFTKYGFLQNVPVWYDGFLSLKFYPPMWYFFNYPIQIITQNINATIFVSLSLILVISFLFISSFGKLVNLSFTKRIAIFFLFFSSPLVIDQIFNIGKFPEFFGWMLFIPLFFIFVYYKDRKLDRWFFMSLAIFYSLILLTHPFLWPGVSFFFFGLFLVKGIKDKIKIIIAIALSLLLVSFWLVPFLTGINDGDTGCKFICFNIEDYIRSTEVSYHHTNPLRELLLPGSIISFSTFISIGFLIMFYLYWNYRKMDRRELLFYSPLMFLSIAILTRLIIFLPILNKTPVNPYNTLLLFSTLFLFLNTEYKRFKFLAVLLVFLIPLIFVFANIYLIEDETLKYKPLDEEFIGISEDINLRYMFVIPMDRRNGYLESPHVSYITITKPELTTPFGGFSNAARRGLLEELNLIMKDFEKLDCESAVKRAKEFDVGELVGYPESCPLMKKCNLELKKETDNYCIYLVG